MTETIVNQLHYFCYLDSLITQKFIFYSKKIFVTIQNKLQRIVEKYKHNLPSGLPQNIVSLSPLT